MGGIAECDSALMQKNKYGNQIIDNYNIEAKREALLDLRKNCFDAIMTDIREGAAKFAGLDLEMAKVLALPEDKHALDSIEAIIRQ